MDDEIDPIKNAQFVVIAMGFFVLRFIGFYIFVKIFSMTLLIILMSIQLIFVIVLFLVSAIAELNDGG